MKKDELKVGMKVRVNVNALTFERFRNEVVEVTTLHAKEGYIRGVVHAKLEGGEEGAFFPSELDAILEAPKQFTLHGRSLKEGDAVWSTCHKGWVYVGSYDQMKQAGFALFGSIDYVSRNKNNEFFWDEPPVVDPRTIPPPLCFIDGLPVRVGSIMYHEGNDKAVVVIGPASGAFEPVLEAQRPDGTRFRAYQGLLSWDFPNTPPAPKKVLQIRTRWYNIYEHDAARTSYSTFNSQEEAQKYALQGCIGQGHFTYMFEGPAAKQQ